MPMRISQFASETAHTVLELAGESIGIDYYPKKYTPALLKDLRTMVTRPDGDGISVIANIAASSEALVHVLQVLVFDWELLEEDGATHIPLTAEALEKLPTDLLGAVFGRIMEAASPGKPEGATSKNLSVVSSSQKAS